MPLLLPIILKYILPGVAVIALLGGIYLKGHHDGATSVQAKMNAAIAEVEKQKSIELAKQAIDKENIIRDLESKSSSRDQQVKTIIKTVKIPENKECFIDSSAIDALNKIRQHD